MDVRRTPLPGVLVVRPDVFRDSRGFFLETFQHRRYAESGIRENFIQDNHSRSTRGTLRGLHAQRAKPQAKLVRVVRGEIFDVAVDIRRGSPTFAKWFGLRLSARNFLQLFVPEGFAHGFYVTSAVAEVEYKCSRLYSKADEIGIRWDDPEIKIRWPSKSPILSPKDADAPYLREIRSKLPRY